MLSDARRVRAVDAVDYGRLCAIVAAQQVCRADELADAPHTVDAALRASRYATFI